eukprot:5679101-Amphidinium_carterae.1
MTLQEWHDDDYEEYELKAAIKEEHDALQKRMQTKGVVRSRPRGTTERLKARFVAKGYTQKVNLDKIYAATPAAITLRMLLTLAQLRNHSVYMSDIQSASLNTPVQLGTTLLVKPPPECETDDNILWKLNKQLYGLRDPP